MNLGILIKSTAPSPAQIEAGNYSKKHLSWHGLRIAIENPKGSVRSGKSKTGTPWSVTMKNDYGYIRKTEAKDGEFVDCFVGPNKGSERVFIVDQIDPQTSRYDEAKVMLGFNTEEQARSGYLENYARGWNGLGKITSATIEQLREWLEHGNTKTWFRLASSEPGKDAGEARKTIFAGVSDLASNEGALSQSEKQGMEMVWRPGDHAMRPLAKQLCGILLRYGTAAGRDDVGAARSERTIQSDELHLGDVGDATQEQAKQPLVHVQWQDDDSSRLGKGVEYSISNSETEDSSLQLADQESIDRIHKYFFPVKETVALVIAPTLVKAIIKTPTMPGSGKVDWEAVPVGASVWITVSDPGSPLAGRHILITKRADGQAVIDPGEARRHGYKVGSWADEAFKQTAGMAHASFQMGKLKEQKKDQERWQQYEQRVQERAPYEAQLREIRGRSTAVAREVEEQFLQSTGISKYGLSQTDKKTVRESATRQALDQGLEQDLADAYGKTMARVRDQIERRFQRDAALRRLKYYQKALELFEKPAEDKQVEGQEPGMPESTGAIDEPQTEDPQLALQALGQLAAAESQPLELEMPAVPLTATTPEEVENAVAEDLIKKTAEAQRRRAENIELKEEARKDAIILRAVEEGQDPLDKIIRTQDRESAKAAVEAFQKLTQAKAERAEVMKIIPPRLPRPETDVVANAIEQMRLKAVEAVDEEKIKEAERRYREQNQLTLDDSFYSVVHEHWNEQDGYLLNGGIQEGATDYLNGLLRKKTGFVSSSAAAALTGLVGRHTGLEMDVGRLTKVFSPGVAAAIVGHWLVDLARKRQLKDKSISGIIDEIEKSNSDEESGLLAMEKKALDRNRELKESYEEIRRQKSNGELSAEATVMRLEAENILQRRENMGKAYGSLSASGTLLLAMRHAQRGIDEKLSINVGMSKDNARRILETLGVKGEKLPDGMSITHNIIGTDEQGQPAMQYQISANASLLAQRWGKTQPIVTKDTKELEKIKSNADPVVGTDNPPHFKKLWTNDLGQEEMFQYRPSQRNDVNFLNKLGGGLITRSTGAGKTLTALGHISHRLKAKPNGKHLIIVPDGLVDQWHDQGTRATDLNILKIPEKQTKEDRAKLWQSVKGGHVVIISHSDALKAQSDVDAIVNGGFESATLDEPQKLKSQASERLGSQAKRIINVPFEGRIALSATPARESMDEIYDWVNWSTKEFKGNDKRGRPMYNSKIGSKVGFGRMYAGAGAGTNAQDEAIQKMIFDKLGPYISGDEFKVRQGYKVNINGGGGFGQSTRVKRTEAQIGKQKEIEAGYEALKSQITTEEKTKAKKTGKGNFYVQHRVNHRLSTEMAKRHWDNLHGGEDNGKTAKVMEGIQKHIKEGRKTHIVYVDSDAQRVSIGQSLRKQKFKNIYDLTELNKRAKFKEEAEGIAKEKNITPDQAVGHAIAQRKTQWASHKEKGDPSFIFIDKTSQEGHNLQKGDVLSLAGRPQDAAALFQILGRGDRSPREGDFHFDSYRYSDSPFEDNHWEELNNQMKIVRSITPALTKSVVGVFLGLAKNIAASRIAAFFGFRSVPHRGRLMT